MITPKFAGENRAVSTFVDKTHVMASLFCSSSYGKRHISIRPSGRSVDGFYHLLRQFGQVMNTKNPNGHRILQVGTGQWLDPAWSRSRMEM